MELFCIGVLTISVFTITDCDNSDTDSHYDYDKVKEFGESLGKPNIYYDEENNLVLLVTIYKGHSNRVLDSGVNSVGIRLNDIENCNVNEELVKYLSDILKIEQRYFTVEQGPNSFKKIVKIKGSKARAYDVIDSLVVALEITAKEEPRALWVTDPTDVHLEQPGEKDSLQENSVRVFDWENKQL